MKKSLILLTVAVLSTSALADTGKVNLYGTLKQSTCVINEGSDSEVNVRLATTLTNELKQANSVAESSATNFEIKLKDCPANYTAGLNQIVKNVTLKFDGSSPNVNQATGTLLGESDFTSTTGVQIQLSEGASIIDLAKGTIQQTSQLSKDVDAHVFNFTAKFVSAEGNVTAGQFWTSVPFMVEYK